MKWRALPVLLGVWLCASQALAWEWFRSESSDVERGNQLLRDKKFDEAVKAYDEAGSATREDPGVQLNKGTALLGAKQYGPARESLRAASRGQADPEVRARALYNLGLSFLDEADALAKEEKLDDAQARLRESVDAFKSSLRAKPGNADAAWNLDLARRRLVEVEKKKEEQKKEEDEKKKDEEEKKKDEEKKNDEQKNEQDDAGTDSPEDGDAGAGDGGEQSKPQENDAGAQGDKGDQQRDAGGQGGEQDAGAGADAGGAQGAEQESAQPPPSRDAMERALDALRDGEESLQKQRARARAQQRPQRVEKDW